jgi:hypothetical protein
LLLYLSLSLLFECTFANTLYTFAISSPSFVRQEVDDDDEYTDWFFWPSRDFMTTLEGVDRSTISLPYAMNRSECEFDEDISPQIRSVSYSSDGKTHERVMYLRICFNQE